MEYVKDVIALIGLCAIFYVLAVYGPLVFAEPY